MNVYSDSELEALTLLAVLVPLFIAGVVVQCFYLNSLAGALRECSRRNRTMEPGHVWLNLIPFFGTVWMFITMNRVADSLKAEFRERGYRTDGDFGRSLGVSYNVFTLLGIVPKIGMVFSVVGFILWILHWVKIRECRKTLAAGSGYNASQSRRRPAFG